MDAGVAGRSRGWAESTDPLPVKRGASGRRRASGYPFKKRLLDLTLCVLVLPIAVPVLAVCAGIVRLSSRGPIFFIQERTGWGGRRFKMMKFRTMVDGAPKMKADLALGRQCQNVSQQVPGSTVEIVLLRMHEVATTSVVSPPHI